MTAHQLREKYLNFFAQKGHTIIPSASLIPKEDPTVLFTTAGMHPLVPYLLGQKHPGGKRLANVQKCLRTADIDDVGDNWHLTFFEMLGNWSLGNYFKKEAIAWSYQFLTDKKWLGIDPKRIYVSVFEGDQDAPFDQESVKIWQEQFKKHKITAKIGERIFPFPKSENWWGPAGQTGPCGPCSEMYYDIGKPKCGPACNPSCKCGKYAEIWNDVFMEYNKTAEGKYELLKQKNVDTGMGLERTNAILNSQDNVYQIELFQPIIKKIEELANLSHKSRQGVKSYRIIADHLKAATFILGDEKGIVPSNVEQGYVLRRLIRRATRHGRLIEIKGIFAFKIAEKVIQIYQDIYPELKKNKDFIINQLFKEEERFKGVLERGLKEFEKTISNKKRTIKGIISGQAVFHLYDTYGFPFEITRELAEEKKLKIDEAGFKQAFKEHQELSRAGAEEKFKGGLADHSEKTTKLHTVTHLLLASLGQVLGKEVIQKGSNITKERLRLDFSYLKKLTADQIKKIEDLVNKKIKENLEVTVQEMSLKQAKNLKAIGVFESKYEQQVKVYSINNFSKEICGGPHLKRTGQLGHFRIIKEESSSAGTRRIKAILE